MPNASRVPLVAMTIAGSDSGGGAGIQADLHTFAAFGVHGVCAITAVTAQNTRGVTDILSIPARSLEAQFIALVDDFPIAAAKIGMLGSAATVRQVASLLGDKPRFPVVLDPVLAATTGAALGDSAVAVAMRRHLFPRFALLTPNVPEAEQLLQRSIRSSADFGEAARALVAAGAAAVLLKGAHAPGKTIRDLLLADGTETWFEHERIGVEGHGTGCTLSAAIAANLAQCLPMKEAVRVSINYVQRALVASYRPGKGTISVLGHRRAAPEID